MAKKKSTKKKKSTRKGSSKKTHGFDMMKLAGLAVGVIVDDKGINMLLDKANLTDPNVRAAIKIGVGEFVFGMDFMKGILKEDSLRNGIGDSIATIGMYELLKNQGMVQADVLGADDMDLAVALEGDDMDGDLNEVNGDDDMGDDIDADLGEVNEDVLGDDD